MSDKPSMAASVKTRRDRRRALEIALCQITAIRNAEEQYMDNIPENLCGSVNYDVAEQAVSTLDEIIEMLGDVY